MALTVVNGTLLMGPADKAFWEEIAGKELPADMSVSSVLAWKASLGLEEADQLLLDMEFGVLEVRPNTLLEGSRTLQ